MNIFDQAKIGTFLYGVHEHRYYTDQEPAPVVEYVVTVEIVKKHIEWHYKEVMTSDGQTPYYYQLKDFGKRVFFTAKEAVEKAAEMAKAYDDVWSKYGEQPMRKTFESLNEGKNNDQQE